MRKPRPATCPEVVAEVKLVVSAILSSLKKPRFVTRGFMEDTLKARGISMPGHDQYFSRVVNNAIIANGYEPWSNLKSGRRYKAYKKKEKRVRIGAEEARSLCGGNVPGSIPGSGLKEKEHA